MSPNNKDSIYLSIVFPAYNEAKRIEKSLNEVQKYFSEKDYAYEVLVSDDGSTDQTADIVKNLQVKWPNLRLISNEHKGKAPTLISGVNASKGKYVLISDVDLSVSIDQTPKLLVWVEDHDYDLAIATREGVGSKRVDEPSIRHLMGRVFNVLVQVLVLPGINDTQCGFKLGKTESLKNVFQRTKLYSVNDPVIQGGRVGAYDVEFLFVAKKLGYKIKEVSVTWVYGDNSKVHKLKDSYYNAKDVVLVKLNDMKGLYSENKKS